MAIPFVIPIGTAASAVFGYMFKFGVIQWLVKFGVVALAGLASYFITDALLPPWVSVDSLNEALTGLHPAVGYALELTGFYSGMPLLLTAMAGAWVFNKVPAFAWWGGLVRLA